LIRPELSQSHRDTFRNASIDRGEVTLWVSFDGSERFTNEMSG
jgi:hypothetical protein